MVGRLRIIQYYSDVVCFSTDRDQVTVWTTYYHYVKNWTHWQSTATSISLQHYRYKEFLLLLNKPLLLHISGWLLHAGAAPGKPLLRGKSLYFFNLVQWSLIGSPAGSTCCKAPGNQSPRRPPPLLFSSEGILKVYVICQAQHLHSSMHPVAPMMKNWK